MVADRQLIFLFVLAGLASPAAFALSAQMEKGINHYNAGQYQEAKVVLDKVLATNSKDWRAHYFLANTCVRLNSLTKAISEYQLCLANKPPKNVSALCKQAILNCKTYKPTLVNPTARISPPTYHSDRFQFAPNTEAASNAAMDARRAEIEAQKARILNEAQAEAQKIRTARDEEIEEAAANSNYRHRGGRQQTYLPIAVRREIEAAAEEKINRITKEAQRRVDSLR